MSTLAAERTRAAKLNDQILALERSLSVLRAERELVQEPLDSYKYPVLTLPNEVVSEIFVHFLPVYPKRAPLAGTFSPTRLTQICRKWRDIVLTTPTLWRAAYLSIDDPDEMDSETDGLHIPFFHQLHKLDLWLIRSRCCPFSIEIEETCDSIERDFIFSSAQCARWEHLKISLMNPPFLAIDGPLPVLHNFELAVETLGSGHSDPIVFPEAPLLRSATLTDYAVEIVILPWVQLTSLTLHCVYPYECVPVLQQTSNLVYCKLSLVDDTTTGRPPDVTLPRLQSLILIPSRRDLEASGYLGTFIVPALRQLETAEEVLENPIDSLTSFISKSGCNLREMYISGVRHISKDAYRRAFPSITHSFDENFIGEGPDVAASSEVKTDADLEQS